MFPTTVAQLTGVPADLNLTSAQQTRITTATQQLQSQFQPRYARIASLPVSEQDTARTALNQQYLAAWLNAAKSVFTPDQLTRYQQLQLQFGGFGSLSDPVAAAALSLSTAQQAQVKQDLTWSAQQRAAIQQAALTNQAQALQMWNAYNTAAQTRLNQLLTPTQQQSWAELTGTPFAFQPMFPTPGTSTTTPGGTGTMTGPGGVPVAPRGTLPMGPGIPPQIQPGAPGPTTGGPAQPGGPTTGGPAQPGGPTTGGTVPGATPRVPGTTNPGTPTNPGGTGTNRGGGPGGR
jgi:hypothetical protein